MATNDSPASRLAALRGFMQQAGLHACVLLTADPHLSEYLPDHWAARAWVSGFDGSAGSLLVTSAFAGLWTDSRYWEQAKNQLAGTGVVLMRAGAAGVPDMPDWACAHLPPKSRLAVDGRAFSLADAEQWQKRLQQGGIQLVLDVDPLASVWQNRPALPAAPIFEHPLSYACVSRAAKLADVRAAMHQAKATHHLLSSLDDIAWLLNLRGSDVAHNPVFLAHLLLDGTQALLFGAASRLTADLAEELAADGIHVQPYEALAEHLGALPRDAVLLIDPDRITAGTLQSARNTQIVRQINPSQLLKAIKTDAQAQHIRQTMVQDGIALCEFFAWLDAALEAGQTITEIDIDRRLTAARASRSGFVGTSFATIAGFNANAAMPHYQATPHSYATLDTDGLLLIDSGGQYLGGTTDITRMVAVGQPTPEQRADCTLVLQAHIALAQASFPEGTAASVLDAIARQPLWRKGLDYGHGTGHGVGYFLNVHEGPQAISVRAHQRPHQAMRKGMLTSNEPGLYRPGKWGIRIENLVLAVPDQRTEYGDFLRFETLTLCPIDTRCLLLEQLSDDEIHWLNVYHAKVREQLQDHLSAAARDWLVARTQWL